MSPISITPFPFRRVLTVISIGALLGFLGVYVMYQSRSFIEGPEIVLEEPDTPLQHEKIVTLHGQARNIVKLTLNGKEIHTNGDGVFAHNLVLEDGYSIVSLNAEDRFGRTTTVTREYVYVPEEATADGV